MADPMRKFIKHMDGVNAARQYDAAAKMMAEHCDARIEKARRYFTKIAEHVRDAQNGSASYAKDRLIQINRIANLGLKRV